MSRPNLLLSLETMISRCCSPRPEIICSFVSLFISNLIVGSSSRRRLIAETIFSSSPFLQALTAIERQGVGNLTPLSSTTLLAAQIVSPVFTQLSFVTTPMSPAGMHLQSSDLLPRTVMILPILSVSPVRAL